MAGRERFNRNHRDSNEDPLLKVAERLGAAWCDEGPLDGWIGWRGIFVPVEIKRPEREGTAHEYRPRQLRFIRFCRERGLPLFVWRTEDDVLRDLGGRRAA